MVDISMYSVTRLNLIIFIFGYQYSFFFFSIALFTIKKKIIGMYKLALATNSGKQKKVFE